MIAELFENLPDQKSENTLDYYPIPQFMYRFCKPTILIILIVSPLAIDNFGTQTNLLPPIYNFTMRLGAC